MKIIEKQGSNARRQVSSEKLTFTQAVCFLIGTLFFLLGSSLAVYVAARHLKERHSTAGQVLI